MQYDHRYNIQLLQPFGVQVNAAHPHQTIHVMSGACLTSLITKYKVVVLRGFAPLTKDALVHYAEAVGPLLEWEFGKVMEMHEHTEPKNYLFTHHHVPFHWDGAFLRPPQFLVFHCIHAPSENAGGETLFTHTPLIWQHASEAEKQAWQQYQVTYRTEKLAHYGGAITEPMVSKHPLTDETILRFAEPVPETMLNPVSVHLEERDDQTLVQLLTTMRHYYYDEKRYCYQHVWQNNDYLFADNFALLHARRAFTANSLRHLRRIQILQG